MLEKRCFSCLCIVKSEDNVNNESLNQLMHEAIDVSLELCPSVWQRVCWQCEALLQKYVRFRRRLHHKYNMLQEMLFHDLPVPSCGQSLLTQSQMTLLCIDENEKYKCSEPTDKSFIRNEKSEVLKIEYDSHITVKVENEEIKPENDSISNDLPLENFKKLPSDSDTESKEKGEKEIHGSLEIGATSEGVGDNCSEGTDKANKSINVKGIWRVDKNTQRIKPKRIFVEVDPTKIKTIHLSKVEQQREHQERATSETYIQFPYKCELCYKGYNYPQKLSNHMVAHQKNGREYSCDICQMWFVSMNKCRSHVVHCHEVRFQCTQCVFSTHDKRFALQHYPRTHEGAPVDTQKYSCQFCGKVFRARKNYLSHERTHQSGRKFQCDLCGKTYTIKQSLIAHVMTHTALKQYGCFKCPRLFATRSAAKQHERLHDATYDYYCDECNVSFKAKSALNHHIQTTSRHINANSFKFKCDQCGRSLQSELMLERHIQAIHSGVKKFSCDKCGHGFHTKRGMRQHMRIQHEGYKPPLRCICDTCGKVFPGSGNLKNHVRIHTGERPYSCEQCGATFKQQSAMRLHVKLVHLKIKRVINRKKKSFATSSADL